MAETALSQLFSTPEFAAFAKLVTPQLLAAPHLDLVGHAVEVRYCLTRAEETIRIGAAQMDALRQDNAALRARLGDTPLRPDAAL